LTHLWRSLTPGPDIPEFIHVVVEIPRASRNRYRYNKDMGIIQLERMVYASCPGNYGFIPQTYSEIGEPMHVMVMMQEAIFPGRVIIALPLGIFRLTHELQEDQIILGVPANDPELSECREVADLPHHLLDEVESYYRLNAQIENTQLEGWGWNGATTAKETIIYAVAYYRSAVLQHSE
jgi:inorganic pyrophosphatase